MKLFALLASFFGFGAESASTQTIDSTSILFTTSTLNDALPASESTVRPGTNLFETHEDNWRQFEAVSSSLRDSIDSELSAIRAVHRSASVTTKSGDLEITAFRRIHVRKSIAAPIAGGPTRTELAALADPAPAFGGFSLSGARAARGGYAFPIGNLVVYGQSEGERLLSICFSLDGSPSIPREKADTLAALLDKHHLLVVHWPSATTFEPLSQFGPALGGSPAQQANDDALQTRRAFEQELAKRSIAYTRDGASDRYRIKVADLELLVSLDNLQRDIARDHDLGRVVRFVDTVLATRLDDSGTFDVSRLFWCLEPTDHVEKAELRHAISNRVDRILVLMSRDENSITWVTTAMLERAGISRETAEAKGFENLARVLETAKIEYSETDGVRLGYLTTDFPIKASLILAPNLRRIAEPTIGWPLLAVAPVRDFLYLWKSRSEELTIRVGRVTVDEYMKGAYPLSTEIYSIGDDGMRATGEFSRATP